MRNDNRAGTVMAAHFILVMLALLISACAPVLPLPEENAPPSEISCQADADCVPASCCHARGAVSKAFAPDCSETLCTQVCEPGTLDCNQGEIKCVEGRCAALIS